MVDGTTTLNVAVAVKPTRSDPVAPCAARRAAIVALSAINGISFTPVKNALPASVSSAAWAAMEQRSTDLPFQVLDLLAERRLANANLGRRPREMPLLGNGQKIANVTEP